jgi:DNA-directed RNA polymerase beta subunit
MHDFFNHPLPANTRKFFDPETTQKWVKENALEAFDHKLNSIESPDFKLKVSDIAYDEPKRFTAKDQKKALLEKRDLSIPLKGTFELIDKKTGETVAKKNTIIAQIPFISPRNTLIINGAEYIAINQQRLKPGIYTRIKESGEAEAHVNVKPGTGLSGKIVFQPEKALFIYELGTTQIKLYGLLKGLGISDADMEAAWGKEIFLKNKLGFKGDELNKFHTRINTFKQ